jgi:hypothetical protein
VEHRRGQTQNNRGKGAQKLCSETSKRRMGRRRSGRVAAAHSRMVLSETKGGAWPVRIRSWLTCSPLLPWLAVAVCLLICPSSKAQSLPICIVSGTVGTPLSANLSTICPNPPVTVNGCAFSHGSIPFAPGINELSGPGCTISGTPTKVGCFTAGDFQIPGGGTTFEVHIVIGPFTLSPKPNPQPTETAVFMPTDLNGNVTTLAAAGAACGFTDPWFNWQQTADVSPNPNPISVCSIVPSNTTTTNICGYEVPAGKSLGQQLLCKYAQSNPNQPLVSPFPDPPDGGGYTYEGYYDNAFPFYFNAADLSIYSTANSLQFSDTPTKPVLNSCLQAAYSFVPTATASIYTTSLVGVINGLPSAPLYTWTWKSTFDGTSGGIGAKNLKPADPGSGTGGVTITSINGVVLPPVVDPSQVKSTASGLAYSRVSQTFIGTVTLTNISSSAVSGPLQILLFGMPVTATLINATGNLSGTPYLTVPMTLLTPGQSATVQVQFKNPSNAPINFAPVIYSGGIN